MAKRFDDYDRVAVITGSDSGIGGLADALGGLGLLVNNARTGAAYVTGASYVVDGGMLLMGPQAGSHLHSDDWRDG